MYCKCQTYKFLAGNFCLYSVNFLLNSSLIFLKSPKILQKSLTRRVTDKRDSDLSGAHDGWVVVVPEDVQQVAVAGPLRVVLQLHGLRVVPEAPEGNIFVELFSQQLTPRLSPRGTRIRTSRRRLWRDFCWSLLRSFSYETSVDSHYLGRTGRTVLYSRCTPYSQYTETTLRENINN